MNCKFNNMKIYNLLLILTLTILQISSIQLESNSKAVANASASAGANAGAAAGAAASASAASATANTHSHSHAHAHSHSHAHAHAHAHAHGHSHIHGHPVVHSYAPKTCVTAPASPLGPNRPNGPLGPNRPSGVCGARRPYGPLGPSVPTYPSLPCHRCNGPHRYPRDYYPFYPQHVYPNHYQTHHHPRSYPYSPWRRPMHPLRNRLPFPIHPKAGDLLPGLAPGMSYLMILENTSFSLEAAQSSQSVYLSKYSNNRYEEWSLEKYTHQTQEYYRIKNVSTGYYLAIHPITGHAVGYSVTLISSQEVKKTTRSSWKIVRHRNGSYSMISVQHNLSLSYSEKSESKLILRPYASLPCQNFYFYDCALCRRRMLGMSK